MGQLATPRGYIGPGTPDTEDPVGADPFDSSGIRTQQRGDSEHKTYIMRIIPLFRLRAQFGRTLRVSVCGVPLY